MGLQLVSLVCLLLVLTNIKEVSLSYQEKQLYRILLAEYDALERPVFNISETLNVTLKVHLQQILDVDVKDQVVQLSAWLSYSWNDYNLKWNESDYDGVSEISLPISSIWKPDILLYNSVDDNFDSTYQSNVLIYSNGMVRWVPPGIFRISCKINSKWFPFDEQNCFLKFGSWVYDRQKLDILADESGFGLSEYIESEEWQLQSTSVVREERYFPCCSQPYPHLKYSFSLRRRTFYYGFSLIIPCALMTAMTILAFLLPPESGEKITLQVTILLSICFFLNIVSTLSPPTSQSFPLVGIFFTICMIIVAVSTLFTVYVLNLHHRTSRTHSMGNMTRKILLYWIPYIIRMERPGVCLKWETLPGLFRMSKPKKQNESLLPNIAEPEDGSIIDSVDVDRILDQYIRVLRTNGGLRYNANDSDKAEIDAGLKANFLTQQKIYNHLKIITNRMSESDRDTEQSNDWKFAARVVDRLCLIFFSALIIIFLLIILLCAPYIIA